MIKHSYFILGDPGFLGNKSNHDGRMWESFKALKEQWKEQILDQHTPHATINKPIDLRVTFLFQKTQAANRDQTYPKRGDLPEMLKFVTDCATATIIKSPWLIINTTCSKQFVDSNPRTEFFITDTHG